VIENKLNMPANSLSESQYLLHAGSNRLGALGFRKKPTDTAAEGVLATDLDLQYLVDAADKIQHGEVVPEHLRRIFDAGPSMGGARPKAAIQKNGVAYVAKFIERNDTFNVPQIEQATLELARACGLDVPATELIELPNHQWVMLIARFDRAKNSNNEQTRKHTVSALTMLGLHESQSPNSSYAALADVISKFGAKGLVQKDREELFSRMIFNILVSNDDDHLRNHAFVWDDVLMGWRLSPLYDVLPKPQVAHERYLHLGVGVQGRLATLDNALSMAGQFGLGKVKAASIIDAIAARVRSWRVFFEEAVNVPQQQCDIVASAFRRPKDVGIDIVAKHLQN
jgi:serine/threonine-protein kinase HipA